MTQVEKTQPLPIVYSSTFLRRPLSRSCAYVPKNERKFYQSLGTVSIGQIIGGVIAITGFSSFLNDLLRNWGEGGFWRRLGMFAIGAFGAIEAATTKTIDDLFLVDLFSSAGIKVLNKTVASSKANNELKDEAKNELSEIRKSIVEEYKKHSGKWKDGVEKEIESTKLANKIFEYFGLRIEPVYNKEKNTMKYYLTTPEMFSFDSEVQYKPFDMSEIPYSLIQERDDIAKTIEDHDNSGELFARYGYNNLSIRASVSNKTGYFAIKDGVCTEFHVQPSLNEILEHSEKLKRQYDKFNRSKNAEVTKVSETPVMFGYYDGNDGDGDGDGGGDGGGGDGGG